MSADLEGKVAIVTGGASGIGRATTKALVDHGARVVIADRAVAEGEQVAEELGGSPVATFIETDVADETSVNRLVAETVRIYGRLDIAHNNAGIGHIGPSLHDTTLEEFQRMIAINLTGVFIALKAEIPAMLAGGGGSIINTSSTMGVVAVPGQSAYVASKHGVVGLTKAAAIEYSSQGVRVNAVLPGVVQTPMFKAMADGSEGLAEMALSVHPIGRLGVPEEVAAAVVWLASDAASFVTGVSLPVDGGILTH